MNHLYRHRRLVGMLMLGAMTTALVAPAANAGRVAGYRVDRVPVRSNVQYVNHGGSGAGTLVAGLIGGLVLGSILSNSNGSVSAGYSYNDPYCGTSYGSLERYHSHYRSCDHPRVVRVIHSGRPVRNICWQDNSWHEYRGSVGVQVYGGGRYGGGSGYRSHDRSWDRDGRWNDRDGRRRSNDRWNHGDRRYKDDGSWNRDGRRGDGDRDWERDGRRGDGDRDWNRDGDDDRRGDDDRWRVRPDDWDN